MNVNRTGQGKKGGGYGSRLLEIEREGNLSCVIRPPVRDLRPAFPFCNRW